MEIIFKSDESFLVLPLKTIGLESYTGPDPKEIKYKKNDSSVFKQINRLELIARFGSKPVQYIKSMFEGENVYLHTCCSLEKGEVFFIKEYETTLTDSQHCTIRAATIADLSNPNCYSINATKFADLIDPLKIPINSTALLIGDAKYASISDGRLVLSETCDEFEIRYREVDPIYAQRDFQIFIFNLGRKYALHWDDSASTCDVSFVDVTDFELNSFSKWSNTEIKINGEPVVNIPTKYQEIYLGFCEYKATAMYYQENLKFFSPTLFQIGENGKLITRKKYGEIDEIVYVVFNKARCSFHCMRACSLVGDDPNLEFVKFENYSN